MSCPSCGQGALFRRWFLRTERCTHCRWRFERGQGHWVGGSEVHMFASYGLSVVLCFPVLLLAEPSTALNLGIVCGHVLVSLALFRYSRAFFLAFDYLVDPAAPPGSDDGGDGAGDPCRPRTPPSRGARVQKPIPRGSRRAVRPVARTARPRA